MSTLKTAPRGLPAGPPRDYLSGMDKARMLRIREALERLASPSPSREAVLADLRLLDEELKSSEGPLPGDLDHYLRRRSYEKALVYLNGGAPGAGSCGRGS